MVPRNLYYNGIWWHNAVRHREQLSVPESGAVSLQPCLDLELTDFVYDDETQ